MENASNLCLLLKGVLFPKFICIYMDPFYSFLYSLYLFYGSMFTYEFYREEYSASILIYYSSTTVSSLLFFILFDMWWMNSNKWVGRWLWDTGIIDASILWDSPERKFLLYLLFIWWMFGRNLLRMVMHQLNACSQRFPLYNFLSDTWTTFPISVHSVTHKKLY